MRSALDIIPAVARAVIVDEPTHRDSTLLAELRETDEPTNDQRDAVNQFLATAVIQSLRLDWTLDEHGLSVERAARVFNEVWPRLP